jgi:autotransporter-associated beta strand protein
MTSSQKNIATRILLHGLLACLLLVSIALTARLTNAAVWRNDISEAAVLALAQQKQFAGSGRVSVSNSSGSGVAIAPGWVLTAAHVVRGRTSVAFTLDGQSYFGVPVTTPNSDVALIELNANSQLPSTTPFISPNPSFDPTGDLVWKAGRGQSGSVVDSQAGNLASADNNIRVGTNIVTSTQSQLGTGVGVSDVVVIQQNNTAANSTDFEVSTAPGDSGGAMYYQRNNQWYVAGTTIGAQGGVGFIDADVASVYAWIESETGLTFAPQPAPTELTFDTDFTTNGVQDTSLSGFGRIWNTTRPMFTGGADGFNYTWENDLAPVAVFGTATTEPQVVRLQSDVTFGGIRFDVTSSTSNNGPYQLIDDGGSLRAATGGASIETNRFSAISAALVGDSSRDITKTGSAELLLTGDNAAFDGEITVAAGTLIISTEDALGTGGFFANKKTTVQAGATLQLRGSGVAIDEHFHIYGDGNDGDGAIFVSLGDHILTERIAVRTDATISVAAGSSLTIGGAQGRFYNAAGAPAMLMQTGGGTVAYDQLSNIFGLAVEEGIAAGVGGINGNVFIDSGAELRPGDSVSGDSIGDFQTENFSLSDGALLTIDLDPVTDSVDLINVKGSLSLDGMLELNLKSVPTAGQSFLIIDNDLNDTATGTFGDSAFVTGSFGGQDFLFSIDYAAGTSNDVSLTFVSGGAVLLGDCNLDAAVDFLDISPFIALLATGNFIPQADCNEDGMVDFLDITPFIAILSGG